MSTAAERATADGLEADPKRWWALGVLCLALGVIVLDNTILNVAIPTLRRQLHANETDLQWVTTSYALVLSGLLLPLAVIGDRFGRRGLLRSGLILFGSASAVAAFTTTPGQLAVARGAMGVGGACTMPATLAILGNIFSERERGRAIAIWTAVAGIAGALGPVVGGLLLSRFWWGSVFLVNVVVVIITLVGVALFVPDSRDPDGRPVDGAGTALWAGALASLLFAIIEGPAKGWRSTPVLASFAGAAVLLLLFARRERRAPAPLLAPSTACHRGMQAGAATVTGLFFAIFGTQFVLTQWIQGPLGHGPLASGLCFVPFALATVLLAPCNPALVRRYDHTIVIVTGLGVMAAALILAGGAVTGRCLLLAVVGLGLLGAGVGIALPSGVELIMTSVPAAKAGSAAGIHETIVEASGALGVAVLGSILAGGAGFAVPLLVGAGALVGGVLAVSGIRRHSPARSG